MKIIPNQPLIFPKLDGQSPFPSDYRRNDDDPGRPVFIFNTDTLYLQFLRETSEDLVEPDLIDPILAINLVIDPGFDVPAAWSASNGFTVNGGEAIHTGGVTGEVETPVVIDASQYILEYTVKSIGVGASVQPYLGSVSPGNNGISRSTTGTFKETIQRTVNFFTLLVFRATGDVTIDDVKLYKIIDGDPGTPVNGWDWNANDWSYTEDGMTHLTGNTSSLNFTGLTAGKHYRMTLEIEESEVGYLSVYEGSNFVKMAKQERQYYYFKASGTTASLKPSDEFTGTILSAYFQEIDSFDNYYGLYWSSVTDETSFDIKDFVTYEDEYATLIMTPANYGGEGLNISNGCGNIQFVIDNEGAEEQAYDSNDFKLIDPDDRYQLMTGYNPCRSWGFDFRSFRLQMRVELEFSNPTFPFNKVQQTKSDGIKDLPFAQRDKLWRVKTEMLDEAAHSCISVIIACQRFTVEEIDYFWEDRNYQIGWDENGRNLTAAAIFQLSEKQSVIYGLNASCDTNYDMKVLKGWNQYQSYKQLDKFNVSNDDTMIIRVNRILIDGVNQLTGPQYLTISRDSLGNYTPDLDIASGINGNWSDAFGGSSWVQNADAFINALIPGKEVQFYDALSVIEVLPGVEFVVDVSLRYSIYSTVWVNRRYNNEGMAFIDVSETPYLQYV